jgi:hypothetical protein
MPDRPVVLVTGAARRLGREIALELAAHGFDIALHYRTSFDEAQATVAELRTLGAEACAFRADLEDEAACEALVPAVVDHFDRLDAVVNNASTFEYDDVDGFGHAAMERHWKANTAPAVILARALHRHRSQAPAARNGAFGSTNPSHASPDEAAAARGGPARAEAPACVVNLLDQKLWNPNPDYFSYTLSKAALEAATTLLAQALAPLVRVCGVAPGVTLVSGPMTEGEFAQAHTLTPLERSSTPIDIARAVRFLVESPAITGTTLLVDGGQHLLGQPRDVLFATRARPTNDSRT